MMTPPLYRKGSNGEVVPMVIYAPQQKAHAAVQV